MSSECIVPRMRAPDLTSERIGLPCTVTSFAQVAKHASGSVDAVAGRVRVANQLQRPSIRSGPLRFRLV
jgi:hypothetical protein